VACSLDVDALERDVRRRLVDDGHEVDHAVAAVSSSRDRRRIGDITFDRRHAVRPGAGVAPGMPGEQTDLVTSLDQCRNGRRADDTRTTRDQNLHCHLSDEDAMPRADAPRLFRVQRAG